MTKYVSLIMANGYSYTFTEEQVKTPIPRPQMPSDLAMIYAGYLVAETDGGGKLIFNMGQCIAVELYEKEAEEPNDG